jgi:hypothetical protein
MKIYPYFLSNEVENEGAYPRRRRLRLYAGDPIMRLIIVPSPCQSQPYLSACAIMIIKMLVCERLPDNMAAMKRNSRSYNEWEPRRLALDTRHVECCARTQESAEHEFCLHANTQCTTIQPSL